MTPSPQQIAELREAEARKQWECEFSLLHGELPTTSEIEAFNAGMLAARRSPAGEGTEASGEVLTVEEVVEIGDKYEFEDPETGCRDFDRLGFANEIARAALTKAGNEKKEDA